MKKLLNRFLYWIGIKKRSYGYSSFTTHMGHFHPIRENGNGNFDRAFAVRRDKERMDKLTPMQRAILSLDININSYVGGYEAPYKGWEFMRNILVDLLELEKATILDAYRIGYNNGNIDTSEKETDYFIKTFNNEKEESGYVY